MASTITRRLAAPTLALALAWIAASVATATETARAEEEPTAAQAAEALAMAAEAFEADPAGHPERGASAALAALADALPALSGRERRRARALLARPTDRGEDQFGDGYTVGRGQVRHAESAQGNFCVTWARRGPDAPDLTDDTGSGTPDYVEAVGAIAELSYAVQVGDLTWRPPKPDQREECGKPRQTDIYLKELGSQGLFGYAAADPGQGNARSMYGYLVIDNDFSVAQFRRFDDPLDAARVTIAHELNHLVQYGYSVRQDTWMFEATATWMEEKVFPDIDDYLNYVPHFARAPGAPITDFNAAGGLRAYGSAVWNHWLENGDGAFGADVVRRAWEVSEITRPSDFALGAYGRAISEADGAGLAREFFGFASVTAEWRTGVGGFPDAAAYPDVRRQGALRPARRGRRGRAFSLNHTAYRLFRVLPRRARAIRLVVRAQRGVRSGIALVARRGGATGGQVVRRLKFLPRGGRASVALRRPRGYQRITAVVVNADPRVQGFSFRRGDWHYRKNNQWFRARLVRGR